MKEFKSTHFLNWGLCLYFIIPYLVFLKYFNFSFALPWSDLAWALRNSITQSTSAAVLVVLLSVVMSQGLLLLPTRLEAVVGRLLFLPQIFPSFYSILIAFSILNPFPMGSVGLVFIYVLINLGFGTLLLTVSTREKMGSMATICEIYGVTRWQFFRRIYFPVLKTDVLNLFFLVFIFCFSSFSIPLIAGGGRGTNIEVLIYEKIFIEQNWSVAMGLSLLQMLFIFALSYFLLKPDMTKATEFTAGRYLKSKLGLALISVYLLIYLGGYLKGLVQSFAYADFFKDYVIDLIESTRVSVQFLAGYLLLNGFILILWLLDFIKRKKFSAASHLLYASTVVVGFTFYLLLPTSQEFDFFKIILGMTILIFPALFRMFLQKPVGELLPQILIAELYGVSKIKIIFEIIFRQLSGRFYLWFSFLTVWFLSDYAILRALGVQTQTLGLLSEGFLSSYRLPLSYLMSLYILIVSLLIMGVFYILTKALYVAYKKSAS